MHTLKFYFNFAFRHFMAWSLLRAYHLINFFQINIFQFKFIKKKQEIGWDKTLSDKRLLQYKWKKKFQFCLSKLESTALPGLILRSKNKLSSVLFFFISAVSILRFCFKAGFPLQNLKFCEILIPILIFFFLSLMANNQTPLYKKWSFPLRISSVNITFTEEILKEKLHFLCSATKCGIINKKSRFEQVMMNEWFIRSGLIKY